MRHPGRGSPRLRGRVLAAVLGGILLASCRRGAPSATLRVAHESDVVSVDPISAPESVTGSVLANLYEPLVAFDRDMVLRPALAASWETLDPVTWVLRLRRGVRFHDGTDVDAREVRAALERARSAPESGIKGALFSVREIRDVDAATIWLRTSRPDPLLLNRLAQVPIARQGAEGLVGTGPYRLVRWTKGESVEADAFPAYWGGPPPFAHVRFVPIVPGPGQIEALRRRAVDIVRFVPENLLGEVRAIPGVRVAARTGLTSSYLWFDTRGAARKNPFADPRVRRAVSLAIDRAAIVKALDGNGVALDQTVPRGIFGHVASLPPLRFDRAEARRLLAEAGWGAGFPTPLAHSPGPTAERVAALVAAMLGEVGIHATLQPWTWTKMFEEWRAARLPFFIGAWRFDNGDAASFLQDCLVTRSAASGLGGNNPGYSNPRLDRLVEESERVIEPAKRLALYDEIARLLADDMPAVPLYHRYNFFGLSGRLRYEPRLDGRILVTDLSVGEPGAARRPFSP